MKSTPKIKNCMVCKSAFKPKQMGQKVCSPKCAISYARASRIYFDQSAKGRKKSMPTLTDERALTQKAFNSYIRKRDEGRGCISCGIKTGQMDAGHYRTRAAAPQLSYDVRNVHLQCRQCNTMKSGNLVPYRAALVERIGEASVEALECNNERAGFTVDYLKRLRSVFNERTRHLDRIRGIESQKNRAF